MLSLSACLYVQVPFALQLPLGLLQWVLYMLMTDSFAMALHLPLATSGDWALGGFLCFLVPSMYGYMREKQLYREYLHEYRQSSSSSDTLASSIQEHEGKQDADEEKGGELDDANNPRQKHESSSHSNTANMRSGRGSSSGTGSTAMSDLASTSGSNSGRGAAEEQDAPYCASPMAVSGGTSNTSALTRSTHSTTSVQPAAAGDAAAPTVAVGGHELIPGQAVASVGRQVVPAMATAAEAVRGFRRGPVVPVYRSPLVHRAISIKVGRGPQNVAPLLLAVRNPAMLLFTNLVRSA